MKKKRKEEEADRGSHRRPCLGGSGGLQPNATPPSVCTPETPTSEPRERQGLLLRRRVPRLDGRKKPRLENARSQTTNPDNGISPDLFSRKEPKAAPLQPNASSCRFGRQGPPLRSAEKGVFFLRRRIPRLCGAKNPRLENTRNTTTNPDNRIASRAKARTPAASRLGMGPRGSRTSCRQACADLVIRRTASRRG